MVKCIFKTTLFSLCASLFIGCSAPGVEYQRIQNVPMLGTTLNIIADIAPDSLSTLLDEALSIDADMKSQMSIFDPNSQVSRINRGESDSLSADIIYNIELARRVSDVSGGLYDITVMPLVEAWGFARKEAIDNPNIDSLLEFVGYKKISVEGNRLIKQDPRIRLDFNSIAKGYTVDKLAKRVAAMGSENFLVDIGGEINCRGVNERGAGWKIGVESPIDGNMTDGEYLQKAITINPNSPLRAMATSGNYRRFYLSDSGEKICHTIDPKTGHSKPSTLLSATVVAPFCALADAYATMLMAAGSQGVMPLVEMIEGGVEVYLIFSGDGDEEYKEYMTAGMEEMTK